MENWKYTENTEIVIPDYPLWIAMLSVLESRREASTIGVEIPLVHDTGAVWRLPVSKWSLWKLAVSDQLKNLGRTVS
jgi:hypothetical protein